MYMKPGRSVNRVNAGFLKNLLIITELTGLLLRLVTAAHEDPGDTARAVSETHDNGDVSDRLGSRWTQEGVMILFW